MATMRLNFQAQQLGGFTPGNMVSGGTPKMPIGAVGSPHFEDFLNPKEAQTTKTNHFLGVLRQIRQVSLASDFNGKLNLCLNKRFPQ